jgi:hypothetical protein
LLHFRCYFQKLYSGRYFAGNSLSGRLFHGKVFEVKIRISRVQNYLYGSCVSANVIKEKKIRNSEHICKIQMLTIIREHRFMFKLFLHSLALRVFRTSNFARCRLHLHISFLRGALSFCCRSAALTGSAFSLPIFPFAFLTCFVQAIVRCARYQSIFIDCNFHDTRRFFPFSIASSIHLTRTRETSF